MNRKETLKILSVIRAAYPNSYKDMSDGDAEATEKLWQMMFEVQPYEIVAAALKSLIAVSKWTPTIAEVNGKVYELTQLPQLGEMEAWELVNRAISNGIYESREEYDKLPPVLQRCVGSPNTLREWAMMDSQTVQSVIQSNFMRSYKAKAQQEREYQMLPTSVRTMLASTAESIKSLPEVES